MRLWNIEEIDKIPLVNEKKKAKGVKVKQVGEMKPSNLPYPPPVQPVS